MNKSLKNNLTNFLVIERHPVIGLDLKGILASEYPRADVTVCMTRAEAEQILQALSAPLCVVINTDLVTRGIRKRLEDCVTQGGRVICLGAPADFGFPASFVQSPFTSQMIIAAVMRASEAEAP